MYRIEGPSSGPGEGINWTGTMCIPDTTPTIANCWILKLSYVLNVKVVISWGTNLSIKIPIVIGNVPFQREQFTTTDYRPPPTNPEFNYITTNPPVNTITDYQPPPTNPEFSYTTTNPPVNISGYQDTSFTPPDGLLTNYNDDKPPPYYVIDESSSH